MTGPSEVTADATGGQCQTLAPDAALLRPPPDQGPWPPAWRAPSPSRGGGALTWRSQWPKRTPGDGAMVPVGFHPQAEALTASVHGQSALSRRGRAGLRRVPGHHQASPQRGPQSGQRPPEAGAAHRSGRAGRRDRFTVRAGRGVPNTRGAACWKHENHPESPHPKELCNWRRT